MYVYKSVNYAVYKIYAVIEDRIEIQQVNNKLKDARSVSSYPYNQTQILQNVKYTK